MKVYEHNLITHNAPILKICYNDDVCVELRVKPDGTLVLGKGSHPSYRYMVVTNFTPVESINYNVVDNWLIITTNKNCTKLYLVSQDVDILKEFDLTTILGVSPSRIETVIGIGYINMNGEKAGYIYDWICHNIYGLW